MEQTPADARAAPSASAPNDIDMGIPSSPKRPRDPAQGNMVSQSQRATPNAGEASLAPNSAVGKVVPKGVVFSRSPKWDA
eukprot:scaffold16955_cov90-Isochrysis_galbana.AAC.1